MKKLRFLSFLLVCILLLASLTGCFADTGLGEPSTNTSELASAPTTEPKPTPPTTDESTFEIHFIDVGQADSALVLCDGKAMLIDGGNRADGNLIYSYLQARSITYLDYVVCTHADEDHVGGLASALTYADAGTIYSPVKEYSSDAFKNFASKVAARQKELIQPAAGTVFSLGSAQITVVGPVGTYSDNNNRSIVLRIVYGETSFLFTGDAERQAETDILASGATLKSTVLKVGHHGAETSTTYPFLREIDPDYAVISVGKNNTYGHPTEDALSRLRDADVKVFRTDMQGDIICKSDGKTVSFTVARNADAVTNPTEKESSVTSGDTPAPTLYIGNTQSKKFHKASCSSLPSEANRIVFQSAQEARDAGYTSCGICKP